LAGGAGAMAAPMQQFAALLQALPQNMAYALQALIAQGDTPGAPPDEASTDEETDAADTADEVAVADEATDNKEEE